METEAVAQEIDIGSVILDTINNLCQSLFQSIDNAIFPLLDDLAFIKKDIATTEYLERILGTDTKTGLLILANALLFAFILYYAVRLMLTTYSGQAVESPYQFLLRAILIAIFMNFSLSISMYLVDIVSAVTTFIRELGENIFDAELSFSNLVNTFNNKNLNVFSLQGILSGVMSMSSFTLIINFALRYILIKVLILLSPFAILCLLNQTTVGLFKSWYKCFLTLLILQVFIALVLLFPYAIMKENISTPLKELLLVGSILTLLKSNEYVKELMGGLGISSNFQSGIAGIKSMFTR